MSLTPTLYLKRAARRLASPGWHETPAATAAQRRHAAHRALPSKLLILSVSAGAGHTRAAEAIRLAAAERGLEAVHLDVMDHVGGFYRKLYTDWYIGLVRRWPQLWRMLYEASDRAAPDGLTQRCRRGIESMLTRRLHARIREIGPDAIVCTHFLPAEMLARQAPDCPVWVQVTDFDLHRAWVHPGMTGYFASNEEIGFRMRACGIPSGAINVTGIPLMPGFAHRYDRRQCAAALGLDPELPTVLLMGGGAGLGGMCEVAERLLRAVPVFQLIVLTGHNRAALLALQDLARRHPGRLFPQPFTQQVERRMACADLAITKPGGLSTSECLAQGLPMILHAPIPGQEDRNTDFLLEQGVALKASDAVTLEYRVRELLGNRARLAALRERALAVARPAAAGSVIQAILNGPRPEPR